VRAKTSSLSRESHLGHSTWGYVIACSSFSELVRGRLGLVRGDRGATAVEYALMAGLIALVIVTAVTIFGQNVITLYHVPDSVFTP
jgi:Flp pilus assembly pilin Flp